MLMKAIFNAPQPRNDVTGHRKGSDQHDNADQWNHDNATVKDKTATKKQRLDNPPTISIGTLKSCLPFIIPDTQQTRLVAAAAIVCIAAVKSFQLIPGLCMKLAIDAQSEDTFDGRMQRAILACALMFAGRVGHASSNSVRK